MGKLGIALGIGGIALASGATALWLLHAQSAQADEEARAQVTGWEARWATARTCLLGAHPLAAAGGDALALAELQSGTVAGQRCTAQIGAITRPNGQVLATEVEQAFHGVEQGIDAVAQAYAFRISATDDELDRRVAELGLAIENLDAAEDVLRGKVGLPPLAREGNAVVKHVEPAPLTLDAVSIEVRAGVVRGDDGSYADAPGHVHAAIAPTAFAAVPDATWMVGLVPAQVFDAHAAAETYAVAALPAAADLNDIAHATLVVPLGSGYAPTAALGAGDERAVVLEPLGTGNEVFRLAVSHDAGKTWALGPSQPKSSGDPKASGDAAFGMGALIDTVIDPHGAVDLIAGVVGDDGDRPTARFHLDATHPTTIPAPSPPLVVGSERCVRAGALWSIDALGSALMGAPPTGEPRSFPLSAPRHVIDCTATAALLEDETMPVGYERCALGSTGPASCAPAFRGASYAFGRAAMLDDGGVAYAAGRGALIALWTEGAGAPTYWKLPRPMALEALVVWNGVPTAILKDRDGTRFTAALAS